MLKFSLKIEKEIELKKRLTIKIIKSDHFYFYNNNVILKSCYKKNYKDYGFIMFRH
jgi:hypothetical protein